MEGKIPAMHVEILGNALNQQPEQQGETASGFSLTLERVLLDPEHVAIAPSC